MNRSYRLVWNGALGAWVAVSEVARKGGKSSPRGLVVAAVAAVALMSGTANAADIVFKGLNVIQPMNAASNWVGGVRPDLGDRGVVSGTATSINTGGISLGALWITSGAAVIRFSQIGSPISLAGLDGVGIQSDSATQILLPTRINLLGDLSFRASNTAGGGFTFPTINGGLTSGIYLGNHTLTLDPVNAANVMRGLESVGVFGTGNVIKTGAGTFSWYSAPDNPGYRTSMLQYTGYTDIREGTFALTGISSLLNSSRVNVNGTLDISGTADGRYDTMGTPGGSSLRNLTGAGQIVLGARNLHLAAGQSDFAGTVSGTGALVVEGGEATLRGASSYSGGTQLKSGRLNVGHNQALGTGELAMGDGTILGFVTDGLTLANNIRLTGTQDPVIDTGAFNETLSGVISGTGFLTKEGVGELTLSGANVYTGATNVAAGTVRAGTANTFSAASAHTVAAGAVLDLAGHNQTIAAMTNGGTVSLPGGTARTTLTVNGPWVGQGGTLNVALASGSGGVVSDRLVLNGATATASGRATVQVGNQGVLGAMTTGNGIEVVSALNGATTTAQTAKDAFSLAGGRIDAGAFEYRLYAADVDGTGENWYLRSATGAVAPAVPGTPPLTVPVPTYRPEVPQFAALPEQLRQGNFVMLSNLHQRVGDESGAGAQRQAWGRIISTDRTVSQTGAVSPNSEGRLNGFQAGTDLWVNPNWHTGVYVGQLDGNMSVTGFARGVANLAVGSNDLRSQYFGAYATWRNGGGFYADTVLQGGRHRYDVSPQLALASHGKGDSLLASVEVGQSFQIAPGWALEPQLQLMHQQVDLDDVAIASATVQQNNYNGWIARVGLRLKGDMTTAAGVLQPYGRLNVYSSSKGTDVSRFIGPGGFADIATSTGGTSTELAAGATLALSNITSLYGELGKLWASGGGARASSGINASVGMKVRW
ncbi:autotransporter outer membrane beta-barrel domain-containing protein [Variovorax sp. N23]|nr:autotransporter outer membrane beta-barrel domain-containing protein [Variovorax sp. N23]